MERFTFKVGGSYDLFTVGSEVLASRFEVKSEDVRHVLLALDFDPKRAYQKLSNILEIFGF